MLQCGRPYLICAICRKFAVDYLAHPNRLSCSTSNARHAPRACSLLRFFSAASVRPPLYATTCFLIPPPTPSARAADDPCPATSTASGTTPEAVESATGTGITVTCATGYSTTDTATCNADNTWDLPTCGGPSGWERRTGRKGVGRPPSPPPFLPLFLSCYTTTTPPPPA